MTKRRNRVCRRIAIALTVALLAGQSHAFVLAEENVGDVPQTEISSGETGADVSSNGNVTDDDNGENTNGTEQGGDNGGAIDQNPDDNENKGDQQGDEDGEDKCICGVKCAEDAVNAECPVCAADYTNCAKNAGEGVNPPAEEALPETVSGNALEAEKGIAAQADAGVGAQADGMVIIYDDIRYVVTGNGEVEVGRQDTDKISGDVDIPAKIEDVDGNKYSVTSIGDEAFAWCQNLRSVKIPGSVTSIEYSAFYECNSLTSVKVPESVTSIGEQAFGNCRSLTSVTIPKNVTVIEAYTCSYCSSLIDVTISENITLIGTYAFSDCTKLKEMRIVVSPDREFRFPEVYPGAFLIALSDKHKKDICLVDTHGNEITGTAFNNAKTVFEEAAKQDRDSDDSTWYGWSLKEPSEIEDTYTVTINVKKDRNEWNGHGRAFALLKYDGGFLETPGQESASAYSISQVPNGTYSIYDITGAPADSLYSRARDTGMDVHVSGMDTEVDVTVNGKNEIADVNYYTATFYDGNAAYGTDTPQQPQIVLGGQRVTEPAAPAASEDPAKAGWRFDGWKTEDGGNISYDFNAGIGKETDIYASWNKTGTPPTHYTITASAAAGGNISPSGTISVNEGANKTFTITPDEGHRMKSVTVDDKDVTAELAAAAAKAQEEAKTYTFIKVTGNHTIHAEFEREGGGGGNPDPGSGNDSNPGGDSPNLGGGDNPNPGGGSDTGGSGGGNSGSGDSAGNGQTAAGSETTSVQAGSGAAGTFVGVNTASDGSKAAGGKEPKTGDTAHMEVYATIAMIAGLTYLLLYFMEESRGMTEREKDAFVAAFVRWGKKGGAFRKGCAVVAIFCLLAYYHAIGKRGNRNTYLCYDE